MARKSKSMKGRDGERKLATGAGRKTAKHGGEAKKPIASRRKSARKRTGSSKQRRG
jgi:hypothetical protein